MLNAAELAQMGATLAGSLPDVCTVQRPTRVRTPGGGYTDTFATITTVPCRISPGGIRPDESAAGGRIRAAASWDITLPAGTDAKASDRIVSGGRTFGVEAQRGPRSYEISRRLVCTEVLS